MVAAGMFGGHFSSVTLARLPAFHNPLTLRAVRGDSMRPMQTDLPPYLPSPARVRMALLRARVLLAIRNGLPAAATRALDIALSAGALLVFGPVLAIIALAIRLQDRGPVLYWQKRVGAGGREFDFPKFRSMQVNADAVRGAIEQQNQHGTEGVTFKMKRDPRVTPVGRILRRFSLDELPQIWCVLKGEMAIVGPRPPLPSEVARYGIHARYRLSVKPGLTCTWQVGGRSDIPFEGQLRLDLEYIRQRSFAGDLKLIFLTVPAVLLGRGAY